LALKSDIRICQVRHERVSSCRKLSIPDIVSPRLRYRYSAVRASTLLFVFTRFHFLTMQATRDRPMINIAKVSDWLTRNANEQLYPRLL
jgi:hypothetical protein